MNRHTSSGMPQITSAFDGWMETIVLLKHKEIVVSGFVTKQEVPIEFQGTIQPLSARAIELKPEGQRSFTWLQIHCFFPDTPLIPGDRFSWNGSNYKIMELKDYTLNGYLEYHAVRDYQDTGTK